MTIHSDFMLFKVTCAVFNICLGLVDLVFLRMINGFLDSAWVS